MLRATYNWTLSLAAHRHAGWALGLVAFAEAIIFPIPPDVLLLPLVVAAPTRAWRLAAICTAGSMLGAVVGYMIGAFLFDQLGRPILDIYDAWPAFERFRDAYTTLGGVIVAGAAVSPIPFKVIALASGAMTMNPVLFVVVGTLFRGARFFLVAWLLRAYGERVRQFVERRLGLSALIVTLVIVAGFAVLRYL